MTETASFAARIRERYPEGLTGLFAIGGTRTTYILEHNRHKPHPGVMDDLQDYADFMLDRYFDFCRMFFELGGQNMVITALGFQSFYERGEKYGHFIAQSTLSLVGEAAVRYYRDLNADPYFIGVDTLLLLPSEHPAHHLATTLTQFQKTWPYQSGRPKILWEIASIPLYTLWHTNKSVEANFYLPTVQSAPDLLTLHNSAYNFFADAGFGTDLPPPQFYLGTSRNGDLKLRTVLPSAFIGGSNCRFYYTPYPTLMMPQAAMLTMLDDLAFGAQKLRSKKIDYAEIYAPELAETEYQQFRALSEDTRAIVGLSRKVEAEFDDT